MRNIFSVALKNLSMMVIIFTIIAITVINLTSKLWLKKHGVVRHDVVSYYSYLPAAFVYNDLSFSFLDDDPDYFFDKMFRYEAPNGGKYQKVSMGLAVLYLPFFLIGHLVAYISGSETSGYSPPYMFFLLFSSAFYLLLAMLMLRKYLLKHHEDWVVALVLLAVVPGTHMLHYTTFEAAMPHIYNFFLFVVFIVLAEKWFREKTFKTAVLLGLVFGLISLIRPTNALIAVFFILFGIGSVKDLIRRPHFFLHHSAHILAISLAAFVVWFPQLLHWKMNTGMWFFYSYEGESFFFSNPQVINGLFSYRKGWLLYTPVMALALAGIGFLYRERREIFLPVLIFTLLNIYVMFCWWAWWYGGSFGMRPMIDSYALMMISLAALVGCLARQGRMLKYAVSILLILLTLHGIFQFLQYRFHAIHFDSMTRAAYWDSFGRIKHSVNLKHLLEEPDYALAKQGIKAVVKPMHPDIRRRLFCDFEILTPNGQYFTSSDERFNLQGGLQQSNERSRSGNYSIKLSGERPYGARFDFLVRTGETYRLSVWQYPHDASGRIVFAAQNERDFYRASNNVVENDENGWGRIYLEVTIPVYITGVLKMYLYNPGSEIIYFDDLKILK